MQTRNETYSVISYSATHLQLIPDNYNDFQKLCRGKQLSSLSSGVQAQLLLSLNIAICKDLAKIQFAFWNFSPKQYLPASFSVPESLPQGVSLKVGFQLCLPILDLCTCLLTVQYLESPICAGSPFLSLISYLSFSVSHLWSISLDSSPLSLGLVVSTCFCFLNRYFPFFVSASQVLVVLGSFFFFF